MKKKFVIYWDNTYSSGPKSQVVEENFFEPNNGFENEEQMAVQRIDVSETTPMDNNHVWVMRVE
jgi:hypothetical protein